MSKKQIIHVDEKPHMKTNVIMLPIDINTVQPEDCVGFIFKNENGVVNILNNLDDIIKSNAYFKAIPQHLYIISDEEIKEGDWYYESEFQLILKKEGKGILKAKKIIATTDTSLTIKGEQEGENTWYNPLPQLSQQFIEKYIEEYNKGNQIVDILVEVEEYEFKQTEWFQEAPYTHKYKEWRLKLDSQNQITIREQKDSWSRKEVIDLISDWTKMKSGLNMNLPNNFNQWIEENL